MSGKQQHILFANRTIETQKTMFASKSSKMQAYSLSELSHAKVSSIALNIDRK
jgi:hypothetical protein